MTNDLTQSNVDWTHQKCRIRWKIELLHREMKQVTGIGKCQCRPMRAQRNHIACSFQVWIYMMRAARAIGQTIYEFKDGLLEDYLKHQLSNPSIKFKTA